MSKVRISLLACFILAGMNIYRFYSFSETALPQHKEGIDEIDLSRFTEKSSSTDDEAFIQIIADKPLFNTNRKPFVKAEVVQIQNKVTSSESEILSRSTIKPLPELLGVLKMDGRDVVFFVVKGKVEPVMLENGDTYDGWMVKEIKACQIILVKDDEEKIVEIVWHKQDETRELVHLPNVTKTDNVLNHRTVPNPKDRLSRVMQ